MRPVYHHRDRRVETHIFICFLAYLLAKVLEQRLRAADVNISAAHALEALKQLKAVEHTWEDQALVVQATRPAEQIAHLLGALGIHLGAPLLRVTNLSATA